MLEYYSGPIGGVCKIESDVIRSKKECKNASEKLGYQSKGQFWTISNSDMPSGCSISNDDIELHLELSTTGVGSPNRFFTPICKRQDDSNSSGTPK